jgi:hypothetical protein
LEALAHGLPVLTTTALRDQLPRDYAGSVIVEADSSVALAEGLTLTLTQLPELTGAAKLLGPAFTSDLHSFSGYVKSLLS